MRITLPEELPPLRMLLVWDNLAGHLNAELLLLMFARGIMVLYTPLGGSWLNMSESIQRILVSRALCGEHPRQPEQIIEWLEAAARGWNRDPTPFEWGGRRAKRRARARERGLGTDGMPYMPWEVAEPVRGGRYEGGGASWRNGDTRVKQPTRTLRNPLRGTISAPLGAIYGQRMTSSNVRTVASTPSEPRTSHRT